MSDVATQADTDLETLGHEQALLDDLPARMAEAVAALETYEQAAISAARGYLAPEGKVDRAQMDRHQHMAHGLAWTVTYVETLRQVAAWSSRLDQEGRFGEIEALLSQILFAEYIAQLMGGLAMNQGEMVRPGDLGCGQDEMRLLMHPALQGFVAGGKTPDAMQAAGALLPDALDRATAEGTGLDDTMGLIRDQFRRFANERVLPYAHDWHLRDALIPDEVIAEMGALGVFGLTIPEAHGGAGLGKIAMCVVSEELSRGYIGVGSLGTRSEIAAELILAGGTEAQKARWLPGIARGDILPTAVFTEPNTGSDLGALRTRAAHDAEAGVYRVTGNKTWITHGARADVMTLLARTDPQTDNFAGLSMFLAEKPRGSNAAPFPAPGMTGGEIEVLGYRGMKEYEIAFDGFEIDESNLLGGREGEGFRQLMATFESARIQTAARAVGVGQNALELGLRYALDRTQFGQPIYAFPRVRNKLVMMAAELLGVRQLTYFSARRKDSGQRCDLEAGMAKLLGARAAWAAADNSVQIHGGNGFALEYPISRVMQDARILNIFEGAGEVQAIVIARRLLERRN